MSAVLEMRRRPKRSEGSVVLESKLRLPTPRLRVVPRKPLVDRLRESTAVPVVQVVAPAGYGKTSLLAEWAADDPRTFAWVTVDDADNELSVFLRYVAAALDRVELLARPRKFSGAADTPISSKLMPILGRAFSSMSKPVVFVLDDADRLQNGDCLAALAVIVEHLPESSQLVLAGRRASNLPLARLRAEGRLLELGVDDLRLSSAESMSYLCSAGLTLTESERDVVAARTEGWPAGLRLAALALSRGSHAERRPEGFAGDDRLVADYLRLEVLSRLSSSDMLFLTRTAVLDQMCGSLCDAVLAQSGSAGVLEQLDASNLFLVPLDRRRRWYRYHRLFRDLLLAELERRERDSVPELNRRAAVWYEDHGATEDAVDHACVAGDFERVARLVGTAAIRAYHGGAMPRVRRWIDWLARHESLERHPSAAAVAAWVRTVEGDLVGAEQLADVAERASAEAVRSHETASVEACLTVIRSAMCRHGAERMGVDAARAVADLPLRSAWRPPALLLHGVSGLLAGDTASAGPTLLEAAEAAKSMGVTGIGAVALAEASVLAAGRNEWDAAESLADEAEELLVGTAVHESGAIVYAAAARAALHRRDVEAARRHLVSAEGLRSGLTRALPWLAVQTRLELARCYLALADPDSAGALLAEADRLLGWRPSLGMLRDLADDLRIQLDACRARSGSWASTLTAAELRLLPLLTTHLSFREIAERLFVSRNTVKTQAISIYRKLGASSRSGAIERASQLGLLDAAADPRPHELVPSG